ncbi:hypothetical protein HDK77DRAFT_477212 [Phyllosticta capitalensis]
MSESHPKIIQISTGDVEEADDSVFAFGKYHNVVQQKHRLQRPRTILTAQGEGDTLPFPFNSPAPTPQSTETTLSRETSPEDQPPPASPANPLLVPSSPSLSLSPVQLSPAPPTRDLTPLQTSEVSPDGHEKQSEASSSSPRIRESPSPEITSNTPSNSLTTNTPTAQTPKPKGGWTMAEDLALEESVRHVVENEYGRSMKVFNMWDRIAERLNDLHEVPKPAGACRMRWSRKLRQDTGYDERQTPNANLVTSAQ